MPPEVLITTYLEMREHAEFVPAYSSDPSLSIWPLANPSAALYRTLYRGVGHKIGWRDREVWSDADLEAWLAQPQIKLFVLHVGTELAGYVELDQQGGNVEIAYFGLFEPFQGRGYGKHLLSYGIQQAWGLGAKRVWVHTCNLDGPHALPNYQARGFKIYKVEEEPMPAKYVE